jgi:hypothetical protein
LQRIARAAFIIVAYPKARSAAITVYGKPVVAKRRRNYYGKIRSVNTMLFEVFRGWHGGHLFFVVTIVMLIAAYFNSRHK